MSDSRVGRTETEERITRKPYQAPRLTVFGAVKDLTAGGSENYRENIREGIPLDNGRS